MVRFHPLRPIDCDATRPTFSGPRAPRRCYRNTDRSQFWMINPMWIGVRPLTDTGRKSGVRILYHPRSLHMVLFDGSIAV